MIVRKRLIFECDVPKVFHIILDQLFPEHRSMPNVLLHSTCPVPTRNDFLNHTIFFTFFEHLFLLIPLGMDIECDKINHHQVAFEMKG